MNILIFGAGNDEKRFGRRFVNRAIKDSHTVYEFSYRLKKESANEISERFQNLIETLPRIDIMLYTVMAGHYPAMPDAFIHVCVRVRIYIRKLRHSSFASQ